MPSADMEDRLKWQDVSAVVSYFVLVAGVGLWVRIQYLIPNVSYLYASKIVTNVKLIICFNM